MWSCYTAIITAMEIKGFRPNYLNKILEISKGPNMH